LDDLGLPDVRGLRSRLTSLAGTAGDSDLPLRAPGVPVIGED
jgi:hypothetical protein